MTSPEQFIQEFGYLALLIGTFLEGETILVAAGFAAHLGYLELPWVWVVAFAGSFAGDQLYFFLGRLKGQTFVARRPFLQARVKRVNQYLEKHQNWLILGFRFVYGFRTVTPFAMGLSGVKSGRFVLLNALSGAVWAMIIGSSGYVFGAAIAGLIGDIKHYEKVLLAAILVVGFGLWLFHVWRSKRNRSKLS